MHVSSDVGAQTVRFRTVVCAFARSRSGAGLERSRQLSLYQQNRDSEPMAGKMRTALKGITAP